VAAVGAGDLPTQICAMSVTVLATSLLIRAKTWINRMWINQDDVREALERFARGMGAVAQDASVSEIAAKKRDVERKILEDGVGTCLYCHEEIHHNPTMVNGGWTWESEDMLGWCDGNPKGGHKHAPKIEVINIET